MSVSKGSGDIDVSAVFEEQLELAESFSFPMGDNASISIGNDGSISVDYSANINDYTTISVSVSETPFVSISAAYTITTTDDYDNSVSTSIEFTHTEDSNNQLPPEPPITEPGDVVDTVTDKVESSPTYGTNIGWSNSPRKADIMFAGATLLLGLMAIGMTSSPAQKYSIVHSSIVNIP